MEHSVTNADATDNDLVLEDAPKLQMNVLPNPSNGHFKVLFKGQNPGGKLEVIDNLGKKMWSKMLQEDEQPEINLEEVCGKGLFFITFSSNNNPSLLQKLIIN